MHDSNRGDDEGDPLATDEKRFAELMREHSKAVFNTLKQFGESIEAAQAKNSAVNTVTVEPLQVTNQENESYKAVVFLADVTEPLEERRKLIASELRQQEIHVIDNIPPPHRSVAHDEAVKAEIARADLAVHLLDHQRWTKIIDDASLSLLACGTL